MEKFITLTEAAKILGIGEEEVMKLAEKGEFNAFRIGGNFLRFKLKDIEEYKKKISPPLKRKVGEKVNYTWKERIYDIFYYYDFYIIVILLIIILLIIIYKF